MKQQSALGHGLVNLAAVHHNLSVPELYEHAIRHGEGEIGAGGTFVAITGQHTGRSPKDKYIVRDSVTDASVNWGDVNMPVTEAVFDMVHQRMLAYMQGRPAYVVDVFAGADPEFRLPVRVVTEQAWHNLFARNMFIRPTPKDLVGFVPEMTIMQAPGLVAMPEFDGLRTSTFVLVNFKKRLVLIGGTSYAGEIKKSVFGYLNYILPDRGVLPMHCSANIGKNGKSAVFFGLSGTGKTTLSADASRTLIGDDEHGWSDRGIFNFEGGCYAKVIKLSKTAEPEIWDTTRRFGTVLENVVLERATRVADLVKCWLVNTGWSGGAYGVGERIRIAHTRAMIRAALDGNLAEASMQQDGHFGLHVPEGVPDVPTDVLHAKRTWSDGKAYDEAARQVAKRFEVNFQQFESHVGAEINAAGIHAAA